MSHRSILKGRAAILDGMLCVLALYTPEVHVHLVSHYVEKIHDAHAGHTTPKWSLTLEADIDVKLQEKHDSSVTERSWSCTLCPEPFENLVTRKEAIRNATSK